MEGEEIAGRAGQGSGWGMTCSPPCTYTKKKKMVVDVDMHGGARKGDGSILQKSSYCLQYSLGGHLARVEFLGPGILYVCQWGQWG